MLKLSLAKIALPHILLAALMCAGITAQAEPSSSIANSLVANNSLASIVSSHAPITPSNFGIHQQRTPGGIAIISLGNQQQFAQAPNVSYQDNPVRVERVDQQWLAIVGLPLKKRGDKSPYKKQHQLIVNGEALAFEAQDKHYTEQYLTVKKKHSNPNNQHWQRIKKESKKINGAFTQFSHSEKFQPFIWPTHGRISSEFGLQRYFNEQPRKPHSGLDIAAVSGTHIVAPSSGTVNLVGDFFFNGNSVFIDHGQGLVTMYCHMSEVKVKQGQKLKQGEIIGAVGKTGRVTGPHLHWTISLNNVRVDPLLFVKQASLNSHGCTAEGTCSE